ncbi:hypothetical protein MKEN_00700700 [Mycena kentingensis (nom. inval.)]|nr:hypothetical protein MKEN_00700700 [Mycena kentingensis (nom. inval.)]
MASTFNITIDDASPLISYGPSGAWQDALASDTAGLAYTANTFHSTTAPGATATIHFKGTGIEIYGGHKPEYGEYTMTVDGKQVASGTAAGNGAQQQLLGAVKDLASGPHTAVLTSTGAGLDIDWANVMTSVGSVGSTMRATIVDDANAAMNYAGSWETASTDAYVNRTVHFTESPGAAASLKFIGNGVMIWGTVSPDHANIQLTIDGEPTLINTQTPDIKSLHPQTLLYYTNDLEPTQHTLIITNPGQTEGTGPFIDLDSITVLTATDTNSAGDAVPASNQSASNGAANRVSGAAQPGGLSVGAIAGIAVGAAFILLGLLGLFLFLFMRRKKRETQRNQGVDPETPIDAELPMQGPTRLSPDTPIQPMPTFTPIELVWLDDRSTLTTSSNVASTDVRHACGANALRNCDALSPHLRRKTVLEQMGNLIWHEYARYVAITASAYAVWSSFFALFYRKFFWDFVAGTLRDPGGLQPSKGSAIFITLIVKFPIIPIFTAIIALVNLAIENPLPLLKGTGLQRSLALRVVVLFFQAFLASLYYQGTNSALWSLIAIICYVRAIALGEKMAEAKDNRGRGGRA